MKPFIHKCATIISTGTLFYLFSEKFFWAFWRQGEDDFANTLWGIALYSLGAWLTLFLINYYKVTTKQGLFIVAFLYAFCMEGIIANTLFTSMMPLILFASLPWHILVTFFFGWYYLPQAIETLSLKKLSALSISLGAIWSLWAVGWYSLPQAAEYHYSFESFLFLALLTTLTLFGVFFLQSLLAKRNQVSTPLAFKKRDGIILAVIFTLYTLTVQIANALFIIPGTIVMFLLSHFLLRRTIVADLSPTTFSPTFSVSRQILFVTLFLFTSIFCMSIADTYHFRTETSFIIITPLFLIFIYKLFDSVRCHLIQSKTKK